MDDGKIVDLLILRDEEAIKQIAEKYGGSLRDLAYGITNNADIAEECENDTYLKAWDSIPPHEPRDYLYPFLARITRHIALNRCRDDKRLKRSAFICELSEEMEQCIPGRDDVEKTANDLALRDLINRFLSRLNAEKRSIFIRRYWYLESIDQISERFGISQSKVKTTLFRCREKLKEQLEKEGYTV